MEQHVRPPAHIVLLAVLLALCSLSVAPGSTHAATCIVGIQPGGFCQNETYDTADGLGDYAVDSASCTQLGGTLSPVDDIASLAECTLGCCCGTNPQQPLSISAACTSSGAFVADASDPTCTATCANYVPPTQPPCGEGVVTQADVDAQCLCGTTQPSVSGSYCCWDGSVRSSGAQCPVPANSCALTNTPVSAPCSCGGALTQTGQVCCSGGGVVDDAADCGSGSVQPSVCGNLIQEGSESCDAVYQWSTSQRTYVKISGVGCTSPTAYCSTQCTCIDTAQQSWCGNGICDASENTQTCAQDCPTQQSCSATPFPPPTNVQGTYDPQTNTVSLDWQQNAQCSSALLGFIIQRSAISGSASQTSPDYVSPQQASTATSFSDDTIPDDIASTATALYYAVGAIYRSTGGSTGVGFFLLTIPIPNNQCQQADSAYCRDAKTAVTCTNYQPQVTPCKNAGSVCQIQGGQALCIQQAPCIECNGVHEEFADPFQTVNEYRPDGSIQSTACGAAMTCYKDLRQTSAELFLMCSQVNSCVGYRTKEACDANMCTRPGGPTPDQSCEWVPTSVDLKSGVCRPRDPAFQDCSLCAQLGSGCTQNTCGNLSSTNPSACYYHIPGPQLYKPDLSTTPVCLNKDDVPCEYLQTQLSCEGGSAYELNVTYSTQGVRTAGDHAILSSSNDVLGRGKCTWFPDTAWASGGYCAKDSDDSERADDKEIPQLYPGTTTPVLRSDVLFDFAAPVTTIAAVPSAFYPRHFSVQVINDSPLLYNICAATDPDCYPTLATSAGISAGTIHHTFQTDEQGAYILHYYAEDIARNIEQVKEFPFFIDSVAPNVTSLNVTLTPYAFNATAILSAARVEFSVSEPSFCTTNLLTGDSLGQASYFVTGVNELNNKFGQGFSITYPQLPDGQYFFNVSCTDVNGNTNPGNTPPIPATIIVDADPTIQKPWPVSASPFKNASVTIHIETQSNADCRYATKGSTVPSFSAMTPYATTGGTVHESTIPVSTGNYTFITACDIGGGQIVYGGQGDTIRFLVDQIPPSTQVCNKQATGASATCVQIVIGPANKQEAYDLTLRCSESGAVQSGCDFQDDIYACAYAAGTPVCQPQPGEYDLATITGITDMHIRYYAVDKAGNAEAVHDDIVHAFDLTPPAPPTFHISP